MMVNETWDEPKCIKKLAALIANDNREIEIDCELAV